MKYQLPNRVEKVVAETSAEVSAELFTGHNGHPKMHPSTGPTVCVRCAAQCESLTHFHESQAKP